MVYDNEIVYKTGSQNTATDSLSWQFEDSTISAISLAIWDGISGIKRAYQDNDELMSLITRLTSGKGQVSLFMLGY